MQIHISLFRAECNSKMLGVSYFHHQQVNTSRLAYADLFNYIKFLQFHFACVYNMFPEHDNVLTDTEKSFNML